jgi:Domain of unknown function (DUF4276)
MHFRIFVEGDTERLSLSNFIKQWLDPQLKAPVGVYITKFQGCSLYLKDVKSAAHRIIKANQDLVAVIGLLDLYGLPPTIYTDTKILNDTAQVRADWCKAKLEKDVNNPKFRQFFAIHEIEAWLLSDFSNMPTLNLSTREKNKISNNPEAVNFNTPPAKLLKQQYNAIGRIYDKKVEGKRIFDKLEAQKVYAKCPNFKLMMDEILSLAQAAGL